MLECFLSRILRTESKFHWNRMPTENQTQCKERKLILVLYSSPNFSVADFNLLISLVRTVNVCPVSEYKHAWSCLLSGVDGANETLALGMLSSSNMKETGDQLNNNEKKLSIWMGIKRTPFTSFFFFISWIKKVRELVCTGTLYSAMWNLVVIAAMLGSF